MTGSERTIAVIAAPAWSAGASGWVEHWAGFAAPAREAVVRAAGITADEVEVPYEFPDRATLERALLGVAPLLHIGPEVAERVVEGPLRPMPSRSRRSDGLYGFENRFRYLTAVVA